MSALSPNANLKEINAYKKQINWGDVPAIYHLVSSSVGELDSILTHGFDSAYKKVINPNSWNLELFGAYKDENGELKVKNKPEIILKHDYTDMGYELHCYPVINGEVVTQMVLNNAQCPFERWMPESMQMLFRVNSLIAFAIFCYQSGDDADLALMKFTHRRVEQLIKNLSEFFHISAIKGYNIAQFYQEIVKRNGNILTMEEG